MITDKLTEKIHVLWNKCISFTPCALNRSPFQHESSSSFYIVLMQMGNLLQWHIMVALSAYRIIHLTFFPSVSLLYNNNALPTKSLYNIIFLWMVTKWQKNSVTTTTPSVATTIPTPTNRKLWIKKSNAINSESSQHKTMRMLVDI